ncbi:hypothetical protein ABE099_17690 [Paenibacillus turicensis]|uniref:hypothetical protein n=1 Tax=Paenibacillus turicensis TaxID=160487 RepID=UPI003D2B683C
MRSLYCIGIVVALMVSGCSVQGEAATSMAQNRSVNTVVQATSESTGKAEQNINIKKKLIPTVVEGTYAKPDYTAVNNGSAIVSKLGDNLYHIDVSMASGYAHHTGEITSDFSWNGERFVLKDEEYAGIELFFTSDGLRIEYEDSIKYGGLNAEPKGTYYLQNTIEDHVPFLNTVYDAVKLPEKYRQGQSDLYIYNIGDHLNKIVYVQAYDMSLPEGMMQEYVAIYDPAQGKVNFVGEPDRYNYFQLSSILREQGATDDVIYEVLCKPYADRWVKLKMALIDEGNTAIRDDDNFKLSVEQAFYIVTGVEGKTILQNNLLDKKTIGSTFVQEVDHWDENKVMIHTYELAANSNGNEHLAIGDWLEVDRATGKVRNSLINNK